MKSDTPLQRGKACLCCRKRKMRCDGLRPVCSQCIKANREGECQYHEKKQISRTQMLQQKVVKLEARLRELEAEQSDSSGASPAPSSSASSSADHSSSTFGVDASAFSSSPANWEPSFFEETAFPSFPSSSSTFLPTPILSDPAHAPEFLDAPLYFGSPFTSSQAVGPLIGEQLADTSSSTPADWWETSNGFCQNKQALLETFFSHRHQCAFDVQIEQFRASLLTPTDKRPHPALMDAIYLLGSYFSRNGDTSKEERHFLARTLCGIPDAMQHSDRVIDVLRASCLLAVYFFATGRVLEGYYHSSIAARLSVSLGLHQIKADTWCSPQVVGYPQAPLSSPKSSIQLAPPKDIAEYEERKAAFQQIFAVDRAWSVATGLPSAIPDDPDTQAQIDRVWAAPLNTYMQFNPGSIYRVMPYPTFRAQAVKLFEKCFRWSCTPVNMKNDMYWMDLRRLETALVQFSANIPTIGLYVGQSGLTHADLDLLTVHTMAHVSMVHLHRELSSQNNPESTTKCLTAASVVTSLIRGLGDEHFDYLDPISSTCWTYVADVYVRALACSSPSQVLQTTFDFFTQELEVLLSAMKRISKTFPIAAIHASKIERDRLVARSAIMGLS